METERLRRGGAEAETDGAEPRRGRTASYDSIRTGEPEHEDVGWYYPDPLREAEGVAGMLAFYSERTELSVDGRPFEETLP